MNDAARKLKLVEEVTTVKRAAEITGGLSQTSKMPGRSWGLSAKHCKTGAKLAKIEGSVCSSCYCMRNNYMYPNVKTAHARRLEGLFHPQWVESMVFLIWWYEEEYFRWLDSGDLRSTEHLEKIIEVCEALPDVKFWMPSHEVGLLRAWKNGFPKNLVVRASGAMVGGAPPAGFPNTSTVVKKEGKTEWAAKVSRNTESVWHCPASLQEGSCGNCRACWSDVRDIKYLQH